jgi:hypothetical protein
VRGGALQTIAQVARSGGAAVGQEGAVGALDAPHRVGLNQQLAGAKQRLTPAVRQAEPPGVQDELLRRGGQDLVVVFLAVESALERLANRDASEDQERGLAQDIADGILLYAQRRLHLSLLLGARGLHHHGRHALGRAGLRREELQFQLLSLLFGADHLLLLSVQRQLLGRQGPRQRGLLALRILQALLLHLLHQALRLRLSGGLLDILGRGQLRGGPLQQLLCLAALAGLRHLRCAAHGLDRHQQAACGLGLSGLLGGGDVALDCAGAEGDLGSEGGLGLSAGCSGAARRGTFGLLYSSPRRSSDNLGGLAFGSWRRFREGHSCGSLFGLVFVLRQARLLCIQAERLASLLLGLQSQHLAQQCFILGPVIRLGLLCLFLFLFGTVGAALSLRPLFLFGQFCFWFRGFAALQASPFELQVLGQLIFGSG